MPQQFEKPTNPMFNATTTCKAHIRWQTGQTPLSKSDHFFLQVSDIEPGLLDIRFDEEEKQLLIPMFKGDGLPLVDLMLIGQDGQFSELVQGSAGYSRITGDGKGRIFCLDYASGYTLWRATGRTVIVCWKPEWLRTITKMFPYHPDDCIAVSSTTYTQSGFANTSWTRSTSTSINYAMATLMPFYMSKLTKSFHDLGVEDIEKILSLSPISKIPVFRAHELDYIELSGTRKHWLKELSDTHDPQHAASLALTIARRLLPEVPVKMSVSELQNLIEDSMENPVIHPQTMDNIWELLSRQLNLRREKALMPVSLPQTVATSHRLEICSSGLPTIQDPEWQGVIVAQAPMGAGKTQRVGRPLAEWATARGLPFMAICHRVSLATELAERLALNSYNDQPPINPSQGLAICLPSITKLEFASFVDKNRVLFIDEISQVLRFFAAGKYCSSSQARNSQVYEHLKNLVTNAQCVVVADAHIDTRTINFLETCRPGESFRIIKVPEPEDAGIQGVYYLGQDAVGYIAQRGLAELSSGGKICVAAEAVTSVKELEEIFTQKGYRTLAVYSDNKGGEPQNRLLANAEVESRYYDVVIASPVISSGISIQHQDVPEEQRFTLGLYVGGGYAHTPVDAFQQLRRVRYLNNFVVGLRQLGKKDIGALDFRAQIQAVEMAANLENHNQQITSFDHFVADIQAEAEHTKNDFAAGLLWQLDAAGWNLVPSSHRPSESFIDAQASAAAHLQKRYVNALISAPVLDDIEIVELRRLRNRTEAQNLMLEAHALRMSFGIGDAPLTRELVSFWDHGRGIKKLDLFDAFRGIVPKNTRQKNSAIHSEYPLATAKILRWLFAGIDIGRPYRDDTAIIVADRIFEQSNLLNFLGVAPALTKKSGQPVRLMNKVLKNIGLAVKEADKRRVECFERELTKKSGTGNPAKRFYAVTFDSYQKLKHLADQRNYRREVTKMVETDLTYREHSQRELH
ncbi:plasmid replication protein, CyRepA1 family [Marinobacter sp.]|uniref:plasmid replication protein, CyRepA1 family n=1 Tax=Marinobacter sp. TaxID=50741 RepID=UPI003A8CFD32